MFVRYVCMQVETTFAAGRLGMNMCGVLDVGGRPLVVLASDLELGIAGGERSGEYEIGDGYVAKWGVFGIVRVPQRKSSTACGDGDR